MSRFSLYFASRTMVPFVRKITSLLHTFFQFSQPESRIRFPPPHLRKRPAICNRQQTSTGGAPRDLRQQVLAAPRPSETFYLLAHTIQRKVRITPTEQASFLLYIMYKATNIPRRSTRHTFLLRRTTKSQQHVSIHLTAIQTATFTKTKLKYLNIRYK